MNPFFIGFDDTDIGIPLNEILNKFPRAFAMCMKDNNTLNDDEQIMIHSKVVPFENLVSICRKCSLVNIDINAMKNIKLFKKAKIVSGAFLMQLFNRQFDVNEIVINMIDFNKTQTKLYAACYNNVYTKLDLLLKVSSMCDLYDITKNIYTREHLNGLIFNIEPMSHWSYTENTLFNMNEVFNKRKLSYNPMRQVNESNDIVINNLSRNVHNNYIDEMINEDSQVNTNKLIETKSEYMNIYESLKKSPKRTYFATIDNNMATHVDTVCKIFKIFEHDESLQYRLIYMMMTSKELCHLVVNNKNLLEKITPLLNKYLYVYKYLWGYAWVSLYIEEAIFSTKSTKLNRFVFDIDTASLLPTFPFLMTKPKTNPYFCLQLNDNLIDIENNCIGLTSLQDHYTYYGVCTRAEAIKRTNIFMTGNSNLNPLDGLDKEIFAVSGSIIPACLQRLNPLFEYSAPYLMTNDNRWNAYFSHYYENADIDLMCGVRNNNEFITHVADAIAIIAKNLKCDVNDIHIEPSKSVSVFVSQLFCTTCINDINSELGTSYTVDNLQKGLNELITNNLSDNNENLYTNLKHYFYRDYIIEKNEQLKKWNKERSTHDSVYMKLMDMNNSINELNELTIRSMTFNLTKANYIKRDYETSFFVSDFSTDQINPEEDYLVFKFADAIKFKLSSSKLMRQFEVFKVEPGDPFKTVARFHNPCVRGYMQGDNFWLLPSCISAFMTMINIDYKYFAGSRNPIDIINKYRMRGYGVILNKNELADFIYFNTNIKTNGCLFYSTNKNDLVGPKTIGDKIFKPRVFIHNVPEQDAYNKITQRYISNEAELICAYEKFCNLNLSGNNMLSRNTISDNGNITLFSV